MSMTASPTWGVLAATMLVGLLGGRSSAVGQDVPYGLAAKPWPVALGNHRVRIEVREKAEAVRVHVPWRRRDRSPAKKAIVVRPAGDDKAIGNVLPVEINRAFGDVVFQPTAGPGEYHLYTMPFKERRIPHQYATTYAPPKSTAEEGWLRRCGLTYRLTDCRKGARHLLVIGELDERGQRSDPPSVVDPIDATGISGQAHLHGREPDVAFVRRRLNRELRPRRNPNAFWTVVAGLGYVGIGLAVVQLTGGG